MHLNLDIFLIFEVLYHTNVESISFWPCYTFVFEFSFAWHDDVILNEEQNDYSFQVKTEQLENWGMFSRGEAHQNLH